MKRTEQLFYLIQSLTKSEKRYFKVYASRHVIGSKNSYLELFDLIVKQKEYNEEKIKSKITDPNLLKNLSTVKVQLATLILKSLRQYKSTLYKRYELRELMDFAHILYDKGLYDYSMRTIAKAKKIAQDYGAYIYLDEITSFEHLLATKYADYEKIGKYLDVTRLEGRNYRAVNSMLATYEELESQLQFLMLKYHRIRSVSTAARFDEVVEHPILKESPVNQPVSCQVRYYAIWADYHYVKRNGDACVENIEKVMKLFDTQPHIVSDTPEEYVRYYNKYMNYTGSFGHYDKFEDAVEKLQAFAASVPKEKLGINLNTEILNYIYNMKFSTELEKRDFEAAYKVVKDFESEERFSELFNIPAQQIVLWYNAFYVYFGMEDYPNALRNLNKLINGNYQQLRVDAQSFARIVNIILHYEMGHYDLIESLVKSTSRFLVSRERRFGFETAFLRFSKAHLSEPFSGPEPFQAFKAELEALFADPQEAIVLYYFDIMSWLDSRITGKSFKEVVEGKKS